MKNKFLLWFWILFPLLAFSQGENDNWYFGNQANINFAGTTPTVVNNSVMNAPAACGSISDSQGNLLFYTNGMTIWDRDHNIMLNGSGLTGTVNSAQVLIMPDLVNADRYYVFTTADSYNNLSYTAYSIVDMTLGSLGSNGQPLGGVDSTKKNIPILDDAGNLITTGAVSVMPHANGSDFWILIPTHKKVLAFLFDNWGLNQYPTITDLYTSTINPYKIFNLKVSPKLTYSIGFDHFVSVGSGHQIQPNYVQVLPFDSNTGALATNASGGMAFSNSQNHKVEAEFNKDGTILYLAFRFNSNYTIWKFDILNNFNIQTLFTNSNISNYGQLQRNNKEEIYFTINSGSDNSVEYLGKILNPDSFTNSFADPTNLFLNGKKSTRGLPQLVLPYAAANPPNCKNDIQLTASENNVYSTYRATNSIIMQTNYSSNSKKIIMKAGDNIVMLPNTHLNSGSDYLALIEDCPVNKQSKPYWTLPAEKKIIVLGKENKELEKDMVVIFPNPTSSQFTIDIENDKLDKWELFDLSGKLVLKGNTTVGLVENLASATYVLKVHSKDKTVNTIKLIKK